jgi:hypothetical protein
LRWKSSVSRGSISLTWPCRPSQGARTHKSPRSLNLRHSPTNSFASGNALFWEGLARKRLFAANHRFFPDKESRRIGKADAAPDRIRSFAQANGADASQDR